MKMKMNRLFVALPLAAALLSGCAMPVLTAKVSKPAPSMLTYAPAKTNAPAAALSFRDARSDAEKQRLSSGLFKVNFDYNGSPLNPVSFVEENVQTELQTRGVALQHANPNQPAMVDVLAVNVDNARTNGFSPFISFTSIKADLKTDTGTKRLTAFVKRGKVPVWSLDEVLEPALNEPLAVATKELAAKINREVYGLRSSDAEVDALIGKIKSADVKNEKLYEDVQLLSFSNNLRAVPTLVELIEHPHENVRMAAISGLGILQAQDQLEFLQKIYDGRIPTKQWQDRALALKAIGDLGSDAAMQYLQAEKAKFANKTDKEAVWTSNIISLYL